MKNIHLIPTDKPSRLMINTIENKLYLQPILHEKTINVLPQHIYITSYEEIKIGDREIIDNECRKLKFTKDETRIGKKVILTDNKDLIKDGVQPIDDEFLEWFVKNPSCERVKIIQHGERPLFESELKTVYKIIIPQETKCLTKLELAKNIAAIGIGKEEPKQETLEEVKDLAYWRANAEEDYLKVPISVLRYISELEKRSFTTLDIENIWNEFVKELPPINNGSSLDFLEYIKQHKN
jgi:hypothetical protein